MINVEFLACVIALILATIQFTCITTLHEKYSRNKISYAICAGIVVCDIIILAL